MKSRIFNFIILMTISFNLFSCNGGGGASGESFTGPVNGSEESVALTSDNGFTRTTYLCADDPIHTDENPILAAPFAHTDLELNAGLNQGDNGCDIEADANCNPGGAIQPVGSIDLYMGGVSHHKPTHHSYMATAKRKINIFASAAGQVTRITRSSSDPIDEWAIEVLVSCNIYYSFAHLGSLEVAAINNLLAAKIPNWNEKGRSYTVTLGQGKERIESGSTHYSLTEKVSVNQGELVATKDRSVIPTQMDFRFVNLNDKVGNIINNDERAYKYFSILPNTPHEEFASHWMRYLSNAEREKFARYLDVPTANKFPETDLESMDFGKAGVDVEDRLNGLWFTPSVYTGTNDLETRQELGVLTLFKPTKEPTDTYIAFGFKAQHSDPSLQKYAVLDPMNWEACGCDESERSCVESCLAEHKRLSTYDSSLITRFFEATIENFDARVNPDPMTVQVGDTVCYDIKPYHGNKYYQLYVEMESNEQINVKFYPSEATSKQCALMPIVDMSSHTFTFRRGATE